MLGVFRRMFPTVRVSFNQLNRKKRYAIALDVISVDSKRYRYAYHRSSWLVAGKADPPAPYRLYTHPGKFSQEKTVSLSARKFVLGLEKDMCILT